MDGRRHSLLRSAILSYLLLVVATVAFFVFLVFENQLDLIAENAVLKGQLSGTRLKAIVENGASPEELSLESRSLGVQEFTLFREDGTRVLEIRDNDVQTENLGVAGRNEFRRIQEAIARRDFENSLFHHVLDRDARVIDLYVPVDYADGSSGIFLATIGLRDIERQMSYLYGQSVVMAVVVLAINLVFAGLVARFVILPLGNLLKGIQAVSEGSMSVEVSVRRNDEIGKLAAAFNTMSAAVLEMREEARGANPLTGLPGNVRIASVIDEGLRDSEPIAVLYADLDNFKAYNDAYGFSMGDKAILFARDCLVEAAKSVAPDVFLGHEGGDDFVAVCPYQVWESVCRTITERFDAGAPEYYNREDRERGFIASVDRQGNPQTFPLMSISVAVVSNKSRPFSHHAELIEVAAEVKKVAKGKRGSSYAIDRRTSASRPPRELPPRGALA